MVATTLTQKLSARDWEADWEIAQNEALHGKPEQQVRAGLGTQLGGIFPPK